MTSTFITDAGHSLAHMPQPTQTDKSTTAKIPFGTETAALGHTLAQQPHPTQRAVLTIAFLFINSLLKFVYLSIQEKSEKIRDEVTL